VGTGETHGLGYERVDDDPNVSVTARDDRLSMALTMFAVVAAAPTPCS
jgi:hypothetical protein